MRHLAPDRCFERPIIPKMVRKIKKVETMPVSLSKILALGDAEFGPYKVPDLEKLNKHDAENEPI